MNKYLVYFIAATLLGGIIGVISGIGFSLMTGNWPGGGWVFLGMMCWVYLATLGLWLIVFLDSKIGK